MAGQPTSIYLSYLHEFSVAVTTSSYKMIIIMNEVLKSEEDFETPGRISCEIKIKRI